MFVDAHVYNYNSWVSKFESIGGELEGAQTAAQTKGLRVMRHVNPKTSSHGK
jgi:hypothetical protein